MSSLNSSSKAIVGADEEAGNRALVCPLLAAYEVELAAVLRVGRIEPDQLLENPGCLGVSLLRDVRLGELHVGRDDERLLAQRHVDIPELEQRLDVPGLTLEDLGQDGGGAIALAPLDEPVGDHREGFVGSISLTLHEEEATELGAGIGVLRVPLDESLEDGLGFGQPLASEVGFAEPREHLPLGIASLGRLLEVDDGLVPALLDEMDPTDLHAQNFTRRSDLQTLLENLESLGHVALLVQLLGDSDVFLDGSRRIAIAQIEVGEAAADLEVRGIDVADALRGLAGLAGAPPLDVLVDDGLVLVLGLDGEVLLRVEVGELQLGLEIGGIELGDLLPDGDGLDDEAVALEEVPDLRIAVGGVAVLSLAGVEVTELLPGVVGLGITRTLVDDLAEERDRLVDATGALFLGRVLLQLLNVDLGRHFPSRTPGSRRSPHDSNSHPCVVPRNDRLWIREGPIRRRASRWNSLPYPMFRARP